MVIENILKVNTSDPKAEELRKRLAALQQKTMQPAQTQPGQPGQPTNAAQAANDAQIAKMSQADQSNPELRAKEERTLSLIMNQIRELINLHNEITKRTKEVENKQDVIDKEITIFKSKHDEMVQKMNNIDSRLEKFMGLYELVTNQYNPFASQPFKLPEQQARQLPPQPISPLPQATPLIAQANTAIPQKAETFKVEDTISKQAATVAIQHEDSQKAIQEFKKVEEMLANLQKEEEKRPEQPPQALTSELHTLLSGFEERLKQQFDKSLQDRLHQGFAVLEQRLQAEVRDALKAEIAAIQKDDKEVQEALNELQELLQASETKNRGPVEDELSELMTEVKRLQDDVKTLPPNLYFRVVDGTILKDLDDLKRSLVIMAPEVFTRHVASGRNDFAEWVEHALQLPIIASSMRKVSSQQDMLRTIQI